MNASMLTNFCGIRVSVCHMHNLYSSFILQKCLDRDPEKRWDCKKLLTHPYLQPLLTPRTLAPDKTSPLIRVIIYFNLIYFMLNAEMPKLYLIMIISILKIEDHLKKSHSRDRSFECSNSKLF